MDAILHEWGFLDRIGRISYKRIMCVQCSIKFRPVFMFVCFASCLGVSGCESVKFWKKAGADEIEVRNMSDTKDVLVVDDAEITRRILTAPPTQGYGQPVTIAPAPVAVQTAQPYSNSLYQGVTSAQDPRVTIYPLDASPDNQIQPATMSAVPVTPPQPVETVMRDSKKALVPVVGNDLSSIYFAYGSAYLDNPSRKALSEIAQTAKFAPVDRVLVEGHASPSHTSGDPISTKIINLKQSMERAQVVAESLMMKGVPPEKIKTTAWGDTKPTGGVDAQNRRVDIITGIAGQ